ncbi:hypothetical protein [Amycolatopsis minnesotensis]|uniref:Uncharacterized protein n=1 Tax=Amycolatopsis minnesotensis TaxID=337894 RepID=A0ABP5DXP3_9PSEU
MSGLSELVELQQTHPAADAPVDVVAAWHERRAVVLEHLAAEGSAVAVGAARSAHRYADELAGRVLAAA